MKNIVLILTLISTLTACNAQQTNTIEVLSATEFKEAVTNKEVQLVDVRTPEEFKEGEIDDALNIDFLQNESFTTQFEKLDKEEPVYIYCRSGNRSGKAANQLQKMGFKEIYDLEGGYMNYPYKK
ncbi:rhodanese-like domain-containing protein [Mesonia sp. MT50]|uniref:Rhodanese-like domain-containing protein n=1 Tax=Mesonia profundi TaxID=3070998 RepID=A0ABU1A1S1_9FLAO|nr:rhodanese-like domain-containing protein [Mesonia profundi]MDQ7917622.1 rhodanese-like domain-containing protein [Mesonia profundi]